MPSDADDTIRAKILRTMDRNGVYYPRHKSIENLVAKKVPVASSDEGRAKELCHELARNDADPVRYVAVDESVALEVDSQSQAAARIRYYDDDQLTWAQEERL